MNYEEIKINYLCLQQQKIEEYILNKIIKSPLTENMGVCTSTNQNTYQFTTINQKMNMKQHQDSFEPPCCEEEQINRDSSNSETCLLDTDELNQNSERATQEQSQREFVNRIVSVHDTPNSKRYYFVYDKMYNVRRKVPKLKNINHSTLIQKRKSLIL